MFRPNGVQRAILEHYRKRYGKARALQQYRAWAADEDLIAGRDPLARMDGEELRRLMLAARDGRGNRQRTARRHLHAIMRASGSRHDDRRQQAKLTAQLDRLAEQVRVLRDRNELHPDAAELEGRRAERAAAARERIVTDARRRMVETSAGLDVAA